MSSLKLKCRASVGYNNLGLNSSRISQTRSQRKLITEDIFDTSFDEILPTSKASASHSTQNEKRSIESLFGKTVAEAGMMLHSGDHPNVLSCDQAKFKRSLMKTLHCDGNFLTLSSTSANISESVTEFVSGLEEYLKLPHRLKWSLLYTETDPECDVANRGNQDSLIRLLLNIDAIQAPLITLLTDTLLEIAYEQNELEPSNLPVLLLGNLRWLDNIVDPSKLCDAMLTVLQAATTEVQREIIHFLPDIITDDFHSTLSDTLTELYSNNTELVPAILDTLTQFTLKEKHLQSVHNNVLRTLHAAQPQHLPCVLHFLLHNTSSAEAPNVLREVRTKLHLPSELVQIAPSSSETVPLELSGRSEAATLNTMIFTTIKTELILRKFITNSLLKAIDDTSPANMRIVDVLLLGLVYDAVQSRRRAVQSTFRNKIRAGLQYDTLLAEAFSAHPTILSEYFNSFKKLASQMIRSPEPAFLNFGACLYRVMFENSSRSPQHQQELVLALLAYLGDEGSTRLCALTLVSSLAQDHTQRMTHFAVFLKSSLDQLERLSLQESRFLLDAVTAVAAIDPNTSLSAELSIYTKKLLNNDDIKFKRLGVLSSVLTLKNSTLDKNASIASCSSSSSVPADCDVDVLSVVQACTARCPPASALFMDELASTILRDGIDTKLERWLTGKLEETFESVFVQDLVPDASSIFTSVSSIQLELSYNLEEEEPAVIVLNLGELVERLELHRRLEVEHTRCSTRHSDLQKNTQLLTLAPHFRLLRMLVSHLNGGDLSAIDGLLGCPLYFPQRDLLRSDAFSQLSSEKQSIVLSCLFFAANWFRELINAFVTQKTQEIKRKVYSRLRSLLEIEKYLCALLPICPDYKPHLATSHLDPDAVIIPQTNGSSRTSGAGKKGRKPKKKKAKLSEDQTQASQGLLPSTQAPSQVAEPVQLLEAADNKVVDFSQYKPFLRELHLDVFCLLFKTMSLDPEIENTHNQLSVPEASFLLNDLNMKLSHIFGATKRFSALGRASKSGLGCWHLELFTPEEVAGQAQRLIKPLCVHLDKIATFFRSLLEDHDGVLDSSGVLSEHTRPVIIVQGQLLTALRHLLAWPQLHRHQQLYTNMLRLVYRKQFPNCSPEELQELSTELLLWGTFCYVRRQTNSLLEISNGVLVVHLLEAVVELAICLKCSAAAVSVDEEDENEGNSEQQDEDVLCSYGHKLGMVVRKLLQRSWTSTNDGAPDKGTAFNQRIALLLQCWLKHSPRPLLAIQQVCATGVQEYAEGTDIKSTSNSFPTLNKGTLNVYLSCLLNHLTSSVKKALLEVSLNTSANLSSSEENAQCLEVWKAAVDVFSRLFTVIKQHHSRNLLSASLKYARPFIEHFLTHGMPVMDACLLSHREEVCKLLKTLQTATRILQIVCTESKVKRDLSLTSYVPLTRRCLASLVFRVKAMLVHHNCPQAFWLGVLKNRNLDGDVISTQDGEVKAPPRSRKRKRDKGEETDSGSSTTERNPTRNTAEDDDSDDTVALVPDEDERSDIELEEDSNTGTHRCSGDEDDDDCSGEYVTEYSESY